MAMGENNLNMMPSSESETSLELMRLNNTLADLMRQQESAINNFDAQEIDINSPEAKKLLDSISEQIAEVNKQIQEVNNRGQMKEAA